MKIAERTATWRRERRVLQRVSRAAWRLEQAGRERGWALASARAEGVSICALAAAAGLSPARVHQITAAAGLDGLEAALGELRAAGWPAPEDPGGDDDAELDGRDLICDRLVDEVDWIRQCSGWLTRLHADDYPPAVGLRPGGDHPERALVVTGLPRVAAILDRIAPTSMNWPGPGGSRTWTPPRCCLTRGPNAAGGWPSRTWSSGPSAPGGGCLLPRPRNWSGPGTPGRPSATSAARSANGPAMPATRSGHVNDHPVPWRPTRAVQETGRHSGVHGAVLTGTPIWQAIRAKVPVRRVVVPWTRMGRGIDIAGSWMTGHLGQRGWAMVTRVPVVAPLIRALKHAAGRVIAEEKAILRDGSAIMIRPLATGDVTAITTWFEGLGPATRYARFLGFTDRLDDRWLSLLVSRS